MIAFQSTYKPSFFIIHHICNICCIRRLTNAIHTQQQNPMIIGFPPFFINLTILVFSPIAHIAIVIKNLPASVKGFVVLISRLNIVLIIVANRENKTNHGNIFDNLTVVVDLLLERYKASSSVIGIIARVRVSLTIVA